MPFGELEVYVEGALGIKETGIFGKSSPYCVLTCGAQRSKTPIAQDAGSNPYWNSTFMFKINRSCQEIGIKIYCHNTLAADDELAYTSLSFRKIFFEGHFVPLQSFNVLRPSGQVGGQIRMSLTFFSDTLKHQQGQGSNPEATHHRTVSEQYRSEYTPEASLRPLGGRPAAARPDYRSDGGYSSPGSIRSPAPGRPNHVQFHPNQQQISFEDPQDPHQSYDNYDDYCPPPNIQAKPKDQRSVQQYDLGVQASPSPHTVDQNSIPGHIPRHHPDPASQPIVPQSTGHRSAEHYVDTTAAEITQHRGHQPGKGHQVPTNSTKSIQPTGSHSEECYNDPALAATPRSRPLTHRPEQEQHAASAYSSIATPLAIFSGRDRHLPHLLVHAPPVHQQAPGVELLSGVAPPVVQKKAQPGSLPVGVQSKSSTDQSSYSSRETDNEGPLYQPRRFANRQQPQPPTDPKSKDHASDSDGCTKSKKSKSTIVERSQKAQAISRLKQVQDQARPKGGLPKIQYPISIQQKVPLDEATSSSREMDNEGPVYRPGRFANRQQQPPLPDLKSQDPGSDSDKSPHSNKSKSSDKSAQLDSRKSQASATPNVANEIQQAEGDCTIQPKEKLTETLAETLEAPTHQSPRLRASSFQSVQSSQLPTAPYEELPTRHHPHVGHTGSDSDVKPNGSTNSEFQISQASPLQATTSVKLSSQLVTQECHSPVCQPPPGTSGQSNQNNQSTSVSQHGNQSSHLPGLDGSYFDAASDESKNSKASYTSAASRRSKTSNASAHSNHSTLVLQSAPAKNPSSNFGGSNLHRSVPLGGASSSNTPNSDVSVHKSLSFNKEADIDGGSGPQESLGSALHLHVSASEDGDLGTKTRVDKDPGASDREDCHVKDEIGQFDHGGDGAGCSESRDSQITGGMRKTQQGDNGEQDETTDIANTIYYTHPVHKYEAKEYEHEEPDLNQQYKGESEKSRIYKQEEEVDNNDHEQDDEDYENYKHEQETHTEEQNEYYENYDHEQETHAEENEGESEGYRYVPVEGHLRVFGNYAPHKQDHIDYANYEHEQENSAEELEQEEYEEESDGYAYTSEVVVPIEGDSGALGHHPPSGVSSHVKMGQAQNHYFQPDSFSGQRTGLHGSSFTRVQSNSPQVSQGRMSRGPDQQFQRYPADNSSPHYEPQQSLPHQDFRNNKPQQHIFSKYAEVHRWLEKSSTAGSPPDSPDKSEELMLPTQDHIYQRQPPHNPHPQLQRPVMFHHLATPDSPDRSEDLVPSTQDHIHQRQPPHNPHPQLQRPATFHLPGTHYPNRLEDLMPPTQDQIYQRQPPHNPHPQPQRAVTLHQPVTPDQVRQYNPQVPDPAQMMPSDSFDSPAVEKPPIMSMGQDPRRNSGLNAIFKRALKLGKASLPFLGDVAKAVVVQEVTGQPVIIGERNRHQVQHMQGGQQMSRGGGQRGQGQQMHSGFVQGRPRPHQQAMQPGGYGA